MRPDTIQEELFKLFANLGGNVTALNSNSYNIQAWLHQINLLIEQQGLGDRLQPSDIGVTVQGYDADLAAIAALTTTGLANRTGAGTWTTDSTSYLSTATAASTYQPLDSDLTAIAALTTTASGRSLLTASSLTAAGLGLTNGAAIDSVGASPLTATTAASTYMPLAGGAFSGAVTSTSSIISRQFGNTVQSLVASGTAQTINWNDGGNINLDLSSATGNVTLTLQNPVNGGVYRILVQQGGTVRNLIFPANTVQPGGGGTTYTGIAGVDFLTVYYNGSSYVVQSVLNSGFLLSAAAIAAAYQPLSGDLTAISALAGTTGIARKTAANTWTLDTTQAPQSNLPYWPLGSAITTANNGTDATNDIDFVANGKAVQCRDAGGNMLWVTPAAGTVTKRADAAWASGSGNGGMGSGLTFSTSTEYYFFLITNGTSIDYGFDTSITAANLRTSTGWAYYRPVGWLKSTSPLAWRTFRQSGDWFWWRDQNAATSTIGGAVATVNVDAPTGFECLTEFTVNSGHAATGGTVAPSFWIGSTFQSNPTVITITWGVATTHPFATTSTLYAGSDIRVQRLDTQILVVGGQIKTFGWEPINSRATVAGDWLSSSVYPSYLVRGFSLENLING